MAFDEFYNVILNAEKDEIKHLKGIYAQAEKDILNRIRIYDNQINVLLKDIDSLTDAEKSILKSKIYQRDYQKMLQKQIEQHTKDLTSKVHTSVKDYMEECYQNGYIGTMQQIAKAGIPLTVPIDEKAVTRAMTLNSKLSKKLYTALGENVTHLKKRVANNISRGIATGATYKEIAYNIASNSNVGFNNAMRIARTEGHRVQVLSQLDAGRKSVAMGCDTFKQWDAALDGRTRPTHRALDGQIVPFKESFESDQGKVEAPGMFGIPSEDINCRCSLNFRPRWALDEDELQILKDRAEYYGLDKTASFEEYKKNFLKMQKAERIKYDEDRQAQSKARREAYFARKAAKQGSIPDFTNMEYADVMKWADSNLKTTFEDLKGANKDFVKETVKALATFESKMDGTIEGLSVRFGGLPSNLFAKYDDKTKTLLLKKTGNLKAFEDKLKDENARYRAKWKRDKDYNATDTFSGTVLHELGHAVDIDTGQSLSRKLGANKELYSKSLDVSAYAGTQMNVRATKASEAWAENFAAYMAGGANAKKVPDEVKEMIEDYFKTKRAKKRK